MEQEPDTTFRHIPGFGGPGSVPGQLKRNAKLKSTFLEPYFDFKTRLARKTGFVYSVDYYPIIQAATSGADTSMEASGAFQAYFYYALIGRNSGNTGALVFRIENRHKLGGIMGPWGLGPAIDYAGQVVDSYENMPWVLSNLYWEQNFFDYKLTFLAGILDATDYSNVYALVDPWTDFFNMAFSNGMGIPLPDPGLGVSIFGMPHKNYYLLTSIHDANGNPQKPLDSFNSFFNESEYFLSIEAGWIKSLDKGYSDNIHLAFWHADERDRAMVPSGWGLAFSFNRLLAEKWSPFLRAEYARDGGAFWEKSISLGCGYQISEMVNQVGLGLNWGVPSESTFGKKLDPQYTAELYCRIILWRVFSITPDLQVLINPALNPDQGIAAVFGLRGRISL